MIKASVLVVFVLLVTVVAVPGQWTTLDSVPSTTTGGTAVAIEDDVVFVNTFTTSILNTRTGVWYTAATRPFSAGYAATAALTGRKVVVTGGLPDTTLTHIFDLATLQWNAVRSLPAVTHDSAHAGNGEKLWVAGGNPNTVMFQEYNSLNDAWTQRADLPSSCPSGSGAFHDAVFLVSCAPGETFLYSSANDAWNTGTSRPASRGYLFDSAGAFNGEVFVVGGNAPGNYKTHEKYIASLDQWTTLVPIPVLSHGAAVAITHAGWLVAVGHYPGSDYVHLYDIGCVASICGDPVVVTFSGDRVQLALFAGVFNLLTTTDLVINAVVDVLPTLPPDENTVMKMVSVVGRLPDGLHFKADCGCDDEGQFVCHSKHFSSTNKPRSVVEQHSHRFEIILPLFSVNIHFRYHTVWAYSEINGSFDEYPPSSWLDVDVTSFAPLPDCSGILCSADRASVRQYEVGSGCLMDISTLAHVSAAEFDF